MLSIAKAIQENDEKSIFQNRTIRALLALISVLPVSVSSFFQLAMPFRSPIDVTVPTHIASRQMHLVSFAERSSENLQDAEEDEPFLEFGAHRRDPDYQKRSKCWILLVDDEKAIRHAVGQMLYEKGYQVTTCADGSTALDVALKGRAASAVGNNLDRSSDAIQVPDVIVSDVRMPGGMDGLELLEAIRSSEVLVEVPVVLLTAKGMPQDRVSGYNAGADAYVPKPFDPDELVTILDTLIARYQELNSSNVAMDDLKRDLDEIKSLLLTGGSGVSKGWVEATNVFLAQDERKILELLAQGLITKEIADQTFLSTRRVEQLLTSMFRKANVKNRTELVRWAISTGNVKI